MDIPLSAKDLEHQFSSKICTRCKGASEGWKCPKCGLESSAFDPFHWKDCDDRSKMQTKCKQCQQAEDNCSCQNNK